MRDVLEEAGYVIEENSTQSGWSWGIGTAVCQSKPQSLDDVVRDAWSSAADYVRDILGGQIPYEKWVEQWAAMNVGQQARLIILCFDDKDDEGVAVSDGLLQAIYENDTLKTTLRTLGDAIENGDITTTQNTWHQAKMTHQLSVPA